MNKEWKERWIQALRSGEYMQTKEVLCWSGGMCCLGVLRHIGDPEDKSKDEEGEELLSSQHLSDFGLTYGDQCILSRMNDEGETFAGIADYIEAKL